MRQPNATGMGFCTSCGSGIEPQWNNCGNCGSIIQSSQSNTTIPSNVNVPQQEEVVSTFQQCRNCGGQIYPGWRKCNSCQEPVPLNNNLSVNLPPQVFDLTDENRVLKKRLQTILLSRIFCFVICIILAYVVWDAFFHQRPLSSELSTDEKVAINVENFVTFALNMCAWLFFWNILVDSRFYNKKQDAISELEFRQRF
jgi:uncharacterized membrane protein YvbJ